MYEVEFNSEDVDKVFAQFGQAAYEAQCLEKQMAILLSYVCAVDVNKTTKLRTDELFEANLEQTFGAIAREIKCRFTLPTDIGKKLDLAVEGRNWLAHHYWWDRASEFTSFNGRQKMELELNELTSLFSQIDRYLTDVAKNWAFEHGLTQKDFDESLEELLSGPTPPREKRRKLNKTEKLIKVYSYRIGEGKGSTLLFELDDHSFWSLCDSGLTYGPENIDPLSLGNMPDLQNALPAMIRPKPKGAKNWKYSIQLARGYSIEILPSERSKFAFKWKLLTKKHPMTEDHTI